MAKTQPMAEAVSNDLARVRRLLARERGTDRGAWLRLSGWGVAAVAAVTLAAYAYDVAGGFRRDNATSADQVRELRGMHQALQQQLAQQTKEYQAEAKRLIGAIATLNADRDRLYSRVSTLEQSLESVTGSLSRQAAALATASAPPPPAAPAATLPKIEAAPPETKPMETAAFAPETSVTRTAFGVDLGSSANLDGLRAIWRREAAASPAVAALQPIVVVRDRGVPGVILHLVAGPLGDAAAAARLCATLPPREKACEPVTYEGQRLALDVAPLPTQKKTKAAPKPAVPRPVPTPASAPARS